jgi:hypothetical protein
MSIDTGANTTVTSAAFDEYFPHPSENQSSQQFRDNFAIIRFAIENLQTAASQANTGVLALQSTVLSNGKVQLTTSFRDGGFTLPVGYPISATAGMIRYNVAASAPEFFDGSVWRKAVQTNANGSVSVGEMYVTTRLTLDYTPTQPKDAVPLAYMSGALANAVSAQNANNSAQANSIAATQADLNAEKIIRANADTALQGQITAVQNNVGNVVSNTITLQAQVQNNANAINDEANARIAADNDFANAVAGYSNAISDIQTQVFTLAGEATQEETWRIANDALLQSQINAVVLSVQVVSNDLSLETTNRIDADSNITNSVLLVEQEVIAETGFRIANDVLLSNRIDSLDLTTSHIYRQDVDPLMVQANNVVWNSVTSYGSGDTVYKDGRVFTAIDPNLNSDPWTPGTTDWADVTDVKNGDLWIIAPGGGNVIKVYVLELDNNDPPNIIGAGWEDVVAGDLSNYLNIHTGGTVTGPVTIANTSITFANSTLLLPNTDLTVDAGRYFFLNKIPNTIGAGDGGFLTVDQNNFNYAAMLPAVANAVANSIIANGLANTNAQYEFSTLRIGTTNDPANGVNDDSMALEPAAHLYLNPGWAGAIAVNANNTISDNRVPSRANAAVYVGNATYHTVKIEAATGNIYTDGNITAAGDISGLSDESLKENVVTLAGSLDKVMQLRGVIYNRKDLPGKPEQVGFIAQEVRPILPQVVHALPNGILSLSYPNMTALLVEAVKELRVENDALRAQIAEILRRLG